MALCLASAPVFCFALSLLFFQAKYSEISRFFSVFMVFFIMVGPIVGGLFVREGNRRRERWQNWRIFAAVALVIWVFVALLLGVGYLFSPGDNW
jgi:hypothetical protein